MKQMSFDVLQDKIRAMKNPTVAGLDARIEYVPEHIRRAAFEEYGAGRKGAAEAVLYLPYLAKMGGKAPGGLL